MPGLFFKLTLTATFLLPLSDLTLSTTKEGLFTDIVSVVDSYESITVSLPFITSNATFSSLIS